MMQEELILLHRARAMEHEALTEIHNRYYTAIYRYIAFRVSDPHAVDDLTSEVFFRLLKALQKQSAPQKTLQGWLYGVASIVVKEHYRQVKRANLSPLSEEIPSNGHNPDQRLEEKLRCEHLLAVMKDLTEEQQEVLALRFGFEMSIREVAQTLEKSEGAVKMLQARAIASLSRRFAVRAAIA